MLGVWEVGRVRNPDVGRVEKRGECRVPGTLRAPLSGTFLQTLPDLVTPLKGHSLFSLQRPPKGLGTNMTVEAT